MRYILLLVLTATLFSCQKELSFDDTVINSYYIRCKIDDSLHNFTFSPIALTDTIQGLNSLSMVAYGSDDVNDLSSISLSFFYDTEVPGPGTYSEDSPVSDYILFGSYNANSTDIEYISIGLISVSDDPLTVTITRRTDTEIEGNFKGAFYRTDLTDGTVYEENVRITEGAFKLPLLEP